jgi:RNA polymerase sigma-70 factor (ECF subfamily)
MASIPNVRPAELYDACIEQFGAALSRLATAYEADPELRRDLLQDIHTSLWRSFAIFDGRCSMRTWTFRVAHNTAASYVTRHMRHAQDWVGLETVEELAGNENHEDATNKRLIIDQLMTLVQRLRPLDRQTVLLYLEGLDAPSIAEITGVSPSNVTTKMHRIRRILARQFQEGEKSNARRPVRGRRPQHVADSNTGNDALDVELASPCRPPV